MNFDRTPIPRAWDFLSTKEYICAFDIWAERSLKSYSRRAFARWGKISSPNCLTLIISGKRSLSKTWLMGFVRAAKLDSIEAAYLGLLVDLEHSTEMNQRETILNKMHSLLSAEAMPCLAGDRLELVKNPRAWTLYHMLGLSDQTHEPSWFKSRLIEKFTTQEIREALDLLKRLQLIAELPNGNFKAKSLKVESPDQLEAAENRIFHRHILEESKSALENIAIDQRSFGSLTVTVSLDREEEFKKEVNQIGKKLLEKYGSAKEIHGNLFRVNFQLYPLTKTEKK